jgi:hypothetical protein
MKNIYNPLIIFCNHNLNVKKKNALIHRKDTQGGHGVGLSCLTGTQEAKVEESL